jgi:hypothetical protein
MMERSVRMRMHELGMIAGTRVAGGAGLALLLADRLERRQRRTLGWVLFTLGALSTIPIGAMVLGRRRREAAARLSRSSPGDFETEFGPH